MIFNDIFSDKMAMIVVMAFAVFTAPPCFGEDSTPVCTQKVNANTDSGPVAKTCSIKSAAPVKKAPVPEKQLLFFMNPNGRPCQMQLSILNKMGDTLTALATIKYIKTTEPGDERMFTTYGIRGLPSLIILDKMGKEIKRFTPGIHSGNDILAALGETAR